VVTEYSYDAASRLVGQTFKNGGTTLGALTYGYDASGSRVSTGGIWARTGLPSTVASATYDAANQQTAFAGATQTFDLDGNLTGDGTNTYTWDARNRLASLSGPSLSASFAYDPLGRRTSKTINGTETRFHYDALTPVQEITSAGGVIANLLTGAGIDEYFARADAGGTRSHLTDLLGSTVAELDASVTSQAEYTYEPFGQTALTGSSGNAFRYTGREDDGTALYYYRARYYHPALQRFISEDPMGFEGDDTNLFAYVRNDPLALTDPAGLNAIAGAVVLAPLGPPGMVAGAVIGTGVGILVGLAITDTINNAVRKARECDTDPNCSRATRHQLGAARIRDPHQFKRDWGALPLSAYDICACKDGSIVIKAVRSCGRSGPSIKTDATWKR